MREDEALLLAVERSDRAGIDHDERIIEAHRTGIHERRLRDVQLRAGRPVEGLEHLGVDGVQLRSLPRANSHRVGEEELADAALSEEPGDLPHDFVEHRDRPKCVECRSIGGVFPRAGRDLDERNAGHWRVELGS
jgi:hypothetical protein